MIILNKKKIIDSGRESINTEIEGLKTIYENSINDSFIKLVDIISSTKDRIFISAVGKPGYIAKKAAATLSSIGVPSFFIHPTEASHGDLGMITKDDAVIVMSNSGGSIELNNIIAYCKRLGITLVGITRKADSFVAKSVDLSIVLDNCKQTNDINVPTTDTIMFMAYMDAIATVLIELKGFNSDNFKLFHPGGKIGASLIKIKEIMRTGGSIPLVDINKNTIEALKEMSEKGLGAVAILENNKLVGIISDGDLRRKTLEHKNILEQPLRNIMTVLPKCINEKSLAVEAVNIMTEKERYIQVLLVVNDDNEVTGIVHIQDLFRAKII